MFIERIIKFPCFKGNEQIEETQLPFLLSVDTYIATVGINRNKTRIHFVDDPRRNKQYW